jgi:hypothetical protein
MATQVGEKVPGSSIPRDRFDVPKEGDRPSWTVIDDSDDGPLASAEHRSHLEVADGQGRFLEQPAQLGLDDLGRPEGGAIVDDEDLLMASQRHRLGAEPAHYLLPLIAA